MIDFNYKSDYQIIKEDVYSDWVSRIVSSENSKTGQIDYVFCDDKFLLEINRKYLKHDTLTDIITFDYSDGNQISGDIFISVERVKENAIIFGVDFSIELQRVMAHGILHLVGYGDKSEEETILMRAKEEEKIKLFHVEQ